MRNAKASILLISKDSKLKDIFDMYNYQVETAFSEKEAFNKISSNHFDLVIIEDDIALMDKIKKNFENIVGIVITDEKNFDITKDYCYVFKPYKNLQLISIINSSLSRVKLEKELKNTMEFMKNIMNSSLDSIITADLKGKITSFNKGAESILGYKAEEMLGKNVAELYPEEEREKRKKWIARILKGESIRNKRVRWIDRYGNLHDISLSISLLKDAEGNVIGTVGIGKDITKEVEAEKQLQEYIYQIREYIKQIERSNMFKELLLDILRHDILNPLTVIKNIAYTLEKEKAELALRNIQKIEEIIRRAAVYGKLESMEELEFEYIDLIEIIDKAIEAVKNLSSERLVKIERIKEKKSYYVYASPWIEEVFINLLSNAIKYSPKKSRVELFISEEREHITVGIADFGSGIPEEEKPYIFDRFGKGKKSKGLGLGLAIVRRIIELHNGRVWVEDNKPKGSIFYVRIPKKQAVT